MRVFDLSVEEVVEYFVLMLRHMLVYSFEMDAEVMFTSVIALRNEIWRRSAIMHSEVMPYAIRSPEADSMNWPSFASISISTP